MCTGYRGEGQRREEREGIERLGKKRKRGREEIEREREDDEVKEEDDTEKEENKKDKEQQERGG